MNYGTVWEPLAQFHATDLFLYPLQTSDKRSFSDVFRGYWKAPVA